MNKTLDKIDEYFQLACGSNGCVDLKAAFKLLWSTLNNSVSAVDLAGVFSISIPSNNPVEALSRDLFHDFLRAYSRLKFPSGGDFVERILEDLRQSKGGIHTGMNPPTSSIMKSTTNAAANAHQQQLLQQNQIHSAESNLIYSIADKTLIRVLLKYDLQLRRAYAAFCGQAVRVGGLVSWDEVKSLNLGMELDGLLSFGGAYSLLPNHFSSQQLEIIFREIISKYSLLANNNTLHTSILFPQFQLLMVLLAHERVEIQIKKNEKIDKLFVKKPNDQRVKLLVDSLVELFKDMGIHKFDDSMSYPLQYRQQQTQFKGGQTSSEGVQLDHTLHGNEDLTMTSNALMKGQITLPLTEKKEDLYTASASNTRQIQSLRLDHLFEDLQRRLMEVINTLNTPNNTTTAATMTPFPETNLSTSKVFDIQALIHVLSNRPDEVIDTKARLPTKPVVICDALPIPVNAPDTIDQLLEAALAHHNLGSYEDSLKFLEAGKIQLNEIIESNKKRHQLSGGSANPNNNIELNYYDLRLYISICKGNVYQSCGDDEQSLVQYLDGYHLSKEIKDYDWEIICLNSIGVLAFFNLRYDVALLCFYLVYDFRDRVYGSDSQDTATSLNNLGCCLYCLNRRGESRLKFERAWNIFAKTVGHRASRTVLVWKNLEKARRSHAAVQTKKDLKESIEMRPDADKLIMGGNFTIQAAVMAETKSKKKKGGGKKKKGK